VQWTHRDVTIACLCVSLVWALAAVMWPLTGKVVPWDSKNHFYPMFRFVGEALSNGEWPLWNPYHFSGHPASSDPQSLLFSPLMVAFAWVMPKASMSAFDVAVFAHLLLGAFGMIAYFALRGWRWEGAVLAAMIFMLGGSATGRLQHTGMILSYAYVPIALALLHAFLTRRSCVFAFLFGIIAAVMAVGRDQVAFLSCMMLIAYALTYLASLRSFAELRSFILPIGVAALTGAALLSIPALLTLQLLKTSSRPAIQFGVAVMGSLPPASFVTALLGDVFGSLRTTFDDWGPSVATLPEGTWTDRSIQYVFMGTLPLVLWVRQGLFKGDFLSRDIRFFVIGMVLAVIYALGWYTPLFEPIFDYFPGVALYRRPADASFILNIMGAVIAGYCLHRWRQAQGTPVAKGRQSLIIIRLVFVSLAIALGIAAWVAYTYAARVGKESALLTEALVGVSIATVCIVLLSTRLVPRRFIAAVLLLIAGAELISRHAASALNGEAMGHYAVFDTLPEARQKGINTLLKELEEKRAQGDHPRVEILGLGDAWQNAGMVFGIEDTIGYNPLRLSQYEKYVGVAENAFDPMVRQFPRTFRGYASRLATLLGIEYLVLNRSLDDLPEHFPRPQNATLIYENADKGTEMFIYRLPPAAHRAYFASTLIPYEEDGSENDEGLPEFDLASEALIDKNHMSLLKGDYSAKEAPPSPLISPDPLSSSTPTQTTPSSTWNGTVSIQGYRRNAVVIRVQTPQSGVLVLHDLWFAGWEVEVNGEPKPLLRMNALFRGVELEAGTHRVIFTFRPFSFANIKSVITSLLAAPPKPE
jgi:hypothetical protein